MNCTRRIRQGLASAFRAPCRAIRLAALIVPILLAGCQDVDDNALTIATVLTGPERENLEKTFRDQRPVRWIIVTSGDDLERLVRRRNPPDLIMGSPASLFESLAAQGLLEPDEPGRRSLSWQDSSLETQHGRDPPLHEGLRLRGRSRT